MDANPYSPPADQPAAAWAPPTTDSEELDRLIALTRLTPLVKAAIGLVASVGALLAASALQLWGAFHLRGTVAAIPCLMLGLGLTMLVLGAKLYRQRLWAAITAFTLSTATAVIMAAWFLFSTMSGFLSLLSLLVPVLATVAAVFAGLAMAPCRRAAAARRQLAASGLRVDF